MHQQDGIIRQSDAKKNRLPNASGNILGTIPLLRLGAIKLEVFIRGILQCIGQRRKEAVVWHLNLFAKVRVERTFWNDDCINIMLTPAHAYFSIEVERSLLVLDGGIGASTGKGFENWVFQHVSVVELQTELPKDPHLCLKPSSLTLIDMHYSNFPRLCFCNKVERHWTGCTAVRPL